MASTLDGLVKELSGIYGDNLYSIMVYGSRANRSEAAANVINRVLIVLNDIAPSDLKRARDTIKSWTAAGNPFPTYFTLEEIEDAADVFPIEFLDMSVNRRVLAGKDPFASLDVPTYNLRHQVEFELRSKLIRLRSLFLPASSDPARLARLMFDSLETFTVIFRHVISLLGGEPPDAKNETIEKLSGMIALDRSVFAKVASYGTETEMLLEPDTELVFAAYLDQIGRVIQAVDKLPDGR